MKISVIIPAYNSEMFLAETVDSLLNQTLRDIQIIVVNDGSTDKTAEIIEDYAKKNSNILSLYQKNSGVSAARNNGIDHAEGKYTVFLDSDDLLTPESLENIYNALEESNADMAICRHISFGYGGVQINPVAESLSKESVIDYTDSRLLWNFLLGNKCYKTEMLKNSEIRFPPLRYSEDGAFTMPLVYEKKPKIIGVDNAIYRYRRHTPKEGFSVSQSISTELINHFLSSMSIVYDAAEKSGMSDDYLQEILYKTCSALINEFYRILWRADSESVELIVKKCAELKSRMTSETSKKCDTVQKDIGRDIYTKSEIAEKPFISVIAKNCTAEFIESVYAQSMPVFELITTENEILPEKENIKFIPSDGFSRNAKKFAKGKLVLCLDGRKPLDSRFFKVVTLLKRSPKFGLFPDFLIGFGAKLFLKIKR